MSAPTPQQARSVAQLGRVLLKGRGSARDWYNAGLRWLAVNARKVARQKTQPVPFDAGAAQTHANIVSANYRPAPLPALDSAAAEVPAPIVNALSQATGVDVAGALGGLQSTATALLNGASAILGIDASGFSGGVNAQQAAYIDAGGSIAEQQKRLLDVEGRTGTASKLIDGTYVTVGGTGRGGPGWSEISDASELPPTRKRKGW